MSDWKEKLKNHPMRDGAAGVIAELEREVARLRELEAVCHCGLTMSQHTESENHSAVEMKQPCPNGAEVARLHDENCKYEEEMRRRDAELIAAASAIGWTPDSDRHPVAFMEAEVARLRAACKGWAGAAKEARAAARAVWDGGISSTEALDRWPWLEDDE